ncbi:MAG: hypothetical protein VX910_05960 [Candidatus Latescibacterota bacterium]|nr:hypothetical protein [Candidatus Latescibacterota bacterium]
MVSVTARLILVFVVFGTSACSDNSLLLDNNDLSSLLSISDVSKTAVQDSGDPELIAGLVVETTVIHTGFVIVTVPFRMTWSIRRDGNTIGSASREFDAGFSPGQSERVRLVLDFGPVASLVGSTDAVTFDLLDTTSLSIVGS